MFHIRSGSIGQEIHSETAPSLKRIQESMRWKASEWICLANNIFRYLIDFLPSIRRVHSSSNRPCAKVVFSITKCMTITINIYPVGFSVPCTYWWLQVSNQIIILNLILHPFRHFIQQTLTSSITLERRTHLYNVKVNSLSSN